MEPSELVADDDEHSMGFSRVFNFGQEIGRQAEGHRDFGRLVEVGLQDVPIRTSGYFKHGIVQ
jgi:hypothetical protein